MNTNEASPSTAAARGRAARRRTAGGTVPLGQETPRTVKGAPGPPPPVRFEAGEALAATAVTALGRVAAGSGTVRRTRGEWKGKAAARPDPRKGARPKSGSGQGRGRIRNTDRRAARQQSPRQTLRLARHRLSNSACARVAPAPAQTHNRRCRGQPLRGTAAWPRGGPHGPGPAGIGGAAQHAPTRQAPGSHRRTKKPFSRRRRRKRPGRKGAATRAAPTRERPRCGGTAGPGKKRRARSASPIGQQASNRFIGQTTPNHSTQFNRLAASASHPAAPAPARAESLTGRMLNVL